MKISTLALTAGLVLGLWAPTAHSQTLTDRRVAPSLTSATSLYKLDADASVVQGCFPPCLCPIQFNPSFRGTFELRRVPSFDFLFQTFRMDNINWLVGNGESEFRLTGYGIYRRSIGLGVHELKLRLVMGDTPVAFDSGLVPGGNFTPLPRIDISVDMNDQFCFDTVLNIRSSPVRNDALIPYQITSGSYQEGCLPPCLCPVFQAQPVSGTMNLLPLGHGSNGFFEFAVVNVDWAIHPPAPSPLPAFTPVSGLGIYQVALLSTSAGGDQRMLLDLNVGGTPDRWDSGLMPNNGPFPIIDLQLAVNDFFCFEQIFSIRSEPQ